MQVSPSRKKLICLVAPGVCDTRASACREVRALIRLDLPTFERPTKAISGRDSVGIASMVAAPATNSQSPANNLRPSISCVTCSLSEKDFSAEDAEVAQRTRGKVLRAFGAPNS